MIHNVNQYDLLIYLGTHLIAILTAATVQLKGNLTHVDRAHATY